MKTRVEPHSCADTMWRIAPPTYGYVADCDCGRVFEHRPVTRLRLLALWRKTVPALGGDVWVDVTRRERILREREARRDGYITGEVIK